MEFAFHDRYGTRLYRTPTHIYLTPHPALRPYVAHYTYCLPIQHSPLDGASSVPPRQSLPLGEGGPAHGAGTDEGPLPEDAPGLTLIPDASGCLVLTLTSNGPECRMYGPTTQAVTVTNDLGVGPPRFFVEFRPGGLFALTGLPQWELADRVWSLPDTVPDLFAPALTAFARSRDLDDFARYMEAALLERAAGPPPLSPLLAQCAPCSCADLAAATGYSPRHLSRLFREGAGMGCKSYLRVLRVNAAAGRLRPGVEPCSLTALAQDLGYFDQAHFIHDFKTTCGVTPGAYRAGLSDFYNEPLKF